MVEVTSFVVVVVVVVVVTLCVVAFAVVEEVEVFVGNGVGYLAVVDGVAGAVVEF